MQLAITYLRQKLERVVVGCLQRFGEIGSVDAAGMQPIARDVAAHRPQDAGYRLQRQGVTTHQVAVSNFAGIGDGSVHHRPVRLGAAADIVGQLGQLRQADGSLDVFARDVHGLFLFAFGARVGLFFSLLGRFCRLFGFSLYRLLCLGRRGFGLSRLFGLGRFGRRLFRYRCCAVRLVAGCGQVCVRDAACGHMRSHQLILLGRQVYGFAGLNAELLALGISQNQRGVGDIGFNHG
nr:MAG TPA: hypothetical protein [Caudoviricetes sp.]